MQPFEDQASLNEFYQYSFLHIAGQGLRTIRRPQVILVLAAGQALGLGHPQHGLKRRRGVNNMGRSLTRASGYWSIIAMVVRGNLPNKLPVQQTEHFNIKLQFVTEATSLLVNTPILHGRRADFRTSVKV